MRRQNLLLDALAREQAIRERAAVADERARLARELHDVVAHSVSTMVVQAEAGESLLARDPKRARDAFVSITSSGRQALGELRRMLGCCASGDGEPALGPQPGLAQLNALVEQMRGVGLPVELSSRASPGRSGRRRPLRLPDRAGGADEHAQARKTRPRAGDGSLPRRWRRARGARRRQKQRERVARRPRNRRHARAGAGCTAARSRPADDRRGLLRARGSLGTA